MLTRTGEPVYVRLAQDIPSIIEVTEGGEPSILKHMISNVETCNVLRGRLARDTAVALRQQQVARSLLNVLA